MDRKLYLQVYGIADSMWKDVVCPKRMWKNAQMWNRGKEL